MSTAISRFVKQIFPGNRREEKLRKTANRLEAFLRALPYEYCGWNEHGVQAISAGFRPLFDISNLRTIEDLLDSLTETEGDVLEKAYDNLIEYGQTFEMVVTAKETGKIIKLNGQCGTLAEGTQVFNVIWAHDVTEHVTQLEETLTNLQDAELKEEEFRNTLNTLPLPIWIRDNDLKLTWVNSAYARIMDKPHDEIIQNQLELPLSAPDAGERNFKIMGQRALAQKRPQKQSGFLIINGKRSRVEVHEIPSGEENIIGCTIDISRVEELESEMRHFEHSNYEVLEQLRTAIAVFDENTHLEFYNATYESLWGLDGKWLNTKPKLTEVLDRLREKRLLPEQANFKQYKEDAVQEFQDLREPAEDLMYLPDGSLLRVVKVPRPRGGLLVTYEDVTQKYELETSYNTLVAVQQATLDNLAEGLAVVGGDGILKLYNPTFAKLWHLDEEFLNKSKHVNDIFEKTGSLFPDNQQEEAKKELLAACFNRSGQAGRFHLKDGSIYAYRTIALPDGNVLITYTDISDTVKVEQALMEKNAALEAAEKLKMDFLANVSYQLRTPLNAMMGFTEILHEEYFGGLNERQKSYTENMIQAGHRLITLVDNILDLSTIEAGYLVLNREEIKIKEAIENVAELTQDWARREGIEIKVECPKNIGKISVDERRFKQVMLHLIRNAIDYTPSSGEINIKASRKKTGLYLEISDNGVGIPPEDLERIFVPFEKSENKNRKPNSANRHSGAGLGLSLVKHIVELHGGYIEIESTPDKGTTITSVFPLQPPPIAEE